MRSLGLLLMLVGGAIVVTAIALALRELTGLYHTAATDPLGGADDQEKQAAAAMLRAIVLGGIGAVPLLTGTVMLKASLLRRMRARMRR